MEATTGLSRVAARVAGSASSVSGSSAASISAGETPARSTDSTIAASTSSSASTVSTTARRSLGVAEMPRSTGLVARSACGAMRSIASIVARPSGAMARPRLWQASAARVPRPPELVTTATLRPAGSGWRSSSAAASNSACAPSTRSTPAWRKSASKTASPRIARAVTDPSPAASVPSRWPLTATIGLRRETRCDSVLKRRGLPKDSMYRAMAATRGSSSHHSSRSLVETSARLPSVTNPATPRPRPIAWPSSAMPSAPDCDEIASRPGRGRRVPSVALSATSGSVDRTPSELGPIRRMPWSRARSSSASWRARPSASRSAKPAETTTSARTPAVAASRATSSTSGAGTASTASSGVSGMSVTRG